MSNLCMYGFEDIACDKFFRSDDDLMVLHPVSPNIDDCFILGESLKTNICDLTSNSIDTGDRASARYDNHQRKQRKISMLSSKNVMLEKNSCPPIPNASFASASDSTPIKNPSSLASGNTLPQSHGLDTNDTCSNGSNFLGNTSLSRMTTRVGNSFSYLPSEIGQSSRDLDFLKHADSSDFLCIDSWPAIGSFEDIERMLSEKDEFGWLSSEDDPGGSGASLKSHVKFPCPETNEMENTLEGHDSLRGSSFCDSSMSNTTIQSEDCSFVNEDGFVPHEQINKHQSVGQSKDYYFGNDSSNHVKELANDVILLPSVQAYHHHPFPSIQGSQRSNNGQLQTPISYEDSPRSHPTDPAPVNVKPSIVKNNCQLQTPVSYEDSPRSHLTDPASVNVKPSIVKSRYQPSSHDPPLDMSATAVPGRGENPHDCQVNQCSVNRSLQNGSVAISGPSTVGKSVDHGKHEVATRAASGSSNVKEDLTASSGLNSVSQEAAGFLQLQLVMEQLDFKTKLGIRNSLYRLAQSAKQRNTCTSLHTSFKNEREPSDTASMAEGTKMYDSSMETDTNPIDRSMADLLFHRASGLASQPYHNSFATLVDRSVACPPVLLENIVGK